ncbi:hypothetical protein [Bradyrhizobium quebecense]|nr:hypothetical protein [Bradyrhizobium quebecense]
MQIKLISLPSRAWVAANHPLIAGIDHVEHSSRLMHDRGLPKL